jgi:signal peptidase
MKIMKKAFTVLISLVLWLIILLAALYAFTTLATRDDSKVTNLAGYTPMIVQTDSMSPTFDSGDLILIKTCDPASLEVGDIITFHTIINNEYALNTHRIEEIISEDGTRSYVTKGDNNDISDTHIIADGDIVGKYIGRLPKVGRVMDVLSSSIGFLVIIVLPMLLFFIYQVYHLIMVSIRLKKAIAAEQAAEQAASMAAAQMQEQDEIYKARAEAEAALAEARRLKAEAEAQLAQAKKDGEEEK